MFYVHKSIPIEQWEVFQHEGANRDLVATLLLTTTSGDIAIHNVYNWNKELDIDLLMQYRHSPGYAADIYTGDFNLRHDHWCINLGVRTSRDKELAEQLYDAFQSASLKLLTARGTVTYSRGAGNSDRYAGTIDLTLGGEAVAELCSSCEVVDCPGFESDHRVTVTTFDMEVECETPWRFRWNLNDGEKSRIQRKISDEFKDEARPPLQSDESIEEYTATVVDKLRNVLEQAGSVSGHVSNSTDHLNAPEVAANYTMARYALDRKNSTVGQEHEHWAREHDLWQKDFQAALTDQRRTAFRQHISEKTKDRKGATRVARQARTWCIRKEPKQMPTLIVDKEDGRHEYSTAAGKVGCFQSRFWGGCTSDHRPAFVDLSSAERQSQLHESQQLQVGELRQLIDEADPNKAAGIDEIPIDLLKLGGGILLQHLEHLFNACLRRSYVPKHFKFAKTVLLRKADKKDYQVPGAWRPIALLSCIGKLLEKAFLNRLMELNDAHKLIPIDQYGTTGRCTTKAIQSLVNQVHTGRSFSKGSNKRRSTLMALDMSGAYDRVNRRTLMRTILKYKAIPRWMAEFVASFVSFRQTTLELPGHPNEPPFWVNTGLPQGSPLSPFLFLLYTSSLFEHMATHQRNSGVRGRKMSMIAYVDDMYLLVTSESYEQNCRWLKLLHQDIMTWAESNSASFDKYSLMHFRDSRKNPCTKMPDIPEFQGKIPEDRKLRVLGVIIDPELKWRPHIHETERRVRTSLQHLHRISGPSWGASLTEMRHYYISKIQPIISYGCAVWFVNEANASKKIMRENIKKLEKLQGECLVQIAGVPRKTCRACLFKELHIEPICVYLDRCVQKFCCRALQTPWSHQARGNRCLPNAMRLENSRHPYHTLDVKTREIVQRARQNLGLPVASDIYSMEHPPELSEEIARVISQSAQAECEKQWNLYRSGCEKRYKPSAWDGWSAASLKLYRRLNRPQSSIIAQCRTGHINLMQYLHRCGKAPSPTCKCGLDEPETAEHLFLCCRMLAEERRVLQVATRGFMNMQTLMTRLADVAADWAICFFGLSMFEPEQQHAAQRLLDRCQRRMARYPDWDAGPMSKIRRLAAGKPLTSIVPQHN